MSVQLPNDIVLYVARLRCVHPEYYDYISIDGPCPLDVPPYSHPQDWCPQEVLLVSSAVYSMASLYSWDCALLMSQHALPSIQAAIRRRSLIRGESRLPRDIIRCLDLDFDLRFACNQLPQLISGLPHLDTVVLSHSVSSMLLFCDSTRSPSIINPLPLPSPFPSSLRAVLFSDTVYRVKMEDIVLLSLMVPQLERLQVAKFVVVGNASLQYEVTAPSYLFPALKWLAIGGFERSSVDIHHPSAVSLTVFLDAVSTGSGLPSLRRLDILTDIQIPEQFLHVHGSLIKCLSVSGAHHDCLRLENTFTRFEALEHLIILANPSLSPMPRSPNQSLTRITVYRPRSPRNLLLPHADVLTQAHDIITEIIAMSPRCPTLETVTFVPPHEPLAQEWIAQQQERILPTSITLSF
ncbi:hypothetical protein DFP72DRAFT_1078093 [Ephemerocybe angulata]|uniref:Uncharacterized protein n=1 Tax=Ephemerocybe angulata TaxID=980116 RepID=A0A8H6HFC9_9AGAR|nr:hypothetical protein DFP72DRAFT_1078093 [Tulosesus angulatus]